MKDKQMTNKDIFGLFCMILIVGIMGFTIKLIAKTTVPKRVLKEHMVEHNMAQYNPKTGDWEPTDAPGWLIELVTK